LIAILLQIPLPLMQRHGSLNQMVPDLIQLPVIGKERLEWQTLRQPARVGFQGMDLSRDRRQKYSGCQEFAQQEDKSALKADSELLPANFFYIT